MNDKFKLSGNDGRRASQECGRAEDLVAYLYGEASPAETKSFSLHLNACADCRNELESFGRVRAGLGDLREDVLSAAPRIDFVPTLAGKREVAARPTRRLSALAALREFFTVSPLWLKAGQLAALLVVFVLVGLTVARTDVRWDDKGFAVQMGVKERTVEVSAAGTFTQQQVDEIAAQKVKVALDEQEKVFKAREEQLIAAAEASQEQQQRTIPVAVKDSAQPRRNQSPNKARRDSRQNNLLTQQEDDEVVSLYDLLREAN